ncbi:hypothetical protein ACVW0P_000419 [Mucilaginibacter sp. UYNi724]
MTTGSNHKTPFILQLLGHLIEKGYAYVLARTSANSSSPEASTWFKSPCAKTQA